MQATVPQGIMYDPNNESHRGQLPPSSSDPLSRLSNLDFMALKIFIFGGCVPHILTLGRLCRAGCLRPEPWNGYPAMPGIKEAVVALTTARRKGLA